MPEIRRFKHHLVNWLRRQDGSAPWQLLRAACTRLSACANVLLTSAIAAISIVFLVYAFLLAGSVNLLTNAYELCCRLAAKLGGRSPGERIRWQLLLVRSALITLVGSVALVIAACSIYAYYAKDLKPPDEIIAASSQGSSRVYDRQGRLLHEFIDPVSGVRNPVSLADMSPYLIAATIATEDSSFYDNPGVNMRGLLRAAKSNLPPPIGEGFGEGSGGSSLTQQLVKNIYLAPADRFDRSISRKVKETVFALELKRRYSDDQILTWYLNQVDYGNFAIGVEAAAQRYFGKEAKDLTLSEAALLAGIPQAPGLLTPALPENQERAKQRQQEVLDLILKHLNEVKGLAKKSGSLSVDQKAALEGMTPGQIEMAKTEPLQFVAPHLDIQAPQFVFYVDEIVTKMCQKGIFKPKPDVPCDQALQRGSLSVTTSLDLELQHIGEGIIQEVISANEDRYNGHNGAIVALDPNNGEILAMVGSRDFFRDDISGQVNIATSQRSHGSAMKVFTYLTAFKQGWVPSTRVTDAPLVLDGGQAVNNWNLAYLGNITVRTALAQSLNVPAVRTVMEVGVDDMQETAHQLGITDLRQQDCGPTITLGACEVKPLDMAYAFAAIANNGVMKGMPSVEDLPEGFRKLDPVSVLKIEDYQGHTLYEYKEPQQEEVVKPAYAYMITHILNNDAIHWSGLDLPFPAASKTGTSEDFKDNVVLGYTPDIVAGVWMGNTDGTPMATGTFSAAGAGPIWHRFMEAAFQHLGLTAKQFPIPPDVEFINCGGRQEVFVSGAPKNTSVCSTPKESNPDIPPRNGNNPERGGDGRRGRPH